MYLVPKQESGTPIKSSDILEVASYAEYNISYALALLISQDTSLVQTIIANHSMIEDKSEVLLKISQEELDAEAEDDSNFNFNINILRGIIRLNNNTIKIIKLNALSYTGFREQKEILQDIATCLSSFFKCLIDAYIQRDKEIAIKSDMFRQDIGELFEKFKSSSKETIPIEIYNMYNSLTEIQKLIIEYCN